MTDDELQAIRERRDRIIAGGFWQAAHRDIEQAVYLDIPALLAEVNMRKRDEYARQLADDLKASFARLEAENAALREIVQVVANPVWYIEHGTGGPIYSCDFCDCAADAPDAIQHKSNCLVPKARAVLAQWKKEEER